MKKPAPPPVVSKSYKEAFDTVSNASKKGWVIINNSDPAGLMALAPGAVLNMVVNWAMKWLGFPAYSATFSQNEYESVDMNCGQGAAVLGAWLILPPTDLKNGDQFSFYTRTKGDYADRLQV